MQFSSCFFLGFLASTAVAVPIAISDTATTVVLQQTINGYPLAIDQKHFSELANIFTADVTANYGSIGTYTNLTYMSTSLQANLKNVTTLHNFGTFKVTALTSRTAETTTYADATHFGHGAYEGEMFYAYGWVTDSWTITSAGWRVFNRTVVTVGAVGNASIFTPQ